MKIRHFFVLMLAGMALFMIGVLVGKSEFKQQQPTEEGTTTRETTVDIITQTAPEAKTERELGTQRYVLPTYRFAGGISGEPLQCRVDSTNCPAVLVEAMLYDNRSNLAILQSSDGRDKIVSSVVDGITQYAKTL